MLVDGRRVLDIVVYGQAFDVEDDGGEEEMSSTRISRTIKKHDIVLNMEIVQEHIESELTWDTEGAATPQHISTSEEDKIR